MVEGKFIGQGIYVEELDCTYSWKELETLLHKDFKQFCGFLNESELSKMLNHKGFIDVNYVYIQNVLNKL